VDENHNTPWTVNIYSGKDSEFKIYEDAGDGYGYEQGEYIIRNVQWNDKTKKVKIGEAVGSYSGAVMDRKMDINIIA
jgi:alpha-D-xyloside xylohydrolase